MRSTVEYTAGPKTYRFLFYLPHLHNMQKSNTARNTTQKMSIQVNVALKLIYSVGLAVNQPHFQ